jgi:hypothetical protein
MKSGWDSGSPMDIMFHLSVEDKAQVGNFLAIAVQEYGVATIEHFNEALTFIQKQANMFFAHLHGGPNDGEVIRLTPAHAESIGIPDPQRVPTEDEMDNATLYGEPLDIPVVYHWYQRRQGTPAPQPGSHADFDYSGTET